MFTYFITMQCFIDDCEVGLEFEWKSPVQLSAGEVLLTGDPLEAVRVDSLSWDVTEPGECYVTLESRMLTGSVSDWKERLRQSEEGVAWIVWREPIEPDGHDPRDDAPINQAEVPPA